MPVILMDNVAFYFPRNSKILENFSLSVNRNEFCYIEGQNSSGKSTIVKILCGIIHPQKGSVSS